MHVDEDLAELAVLELAGADVDLVAADPRLLGVALAPAGHHVPLGDVAVDELGGGLLDGFLLGGRWALGVGR
ncbi:hypothetical protein D3C83_267380 [compost metagenome]